MYKLRTITPEIYDLLNVSGMTVQKAREYDDRIRQAHLNLITNERDNAISLPSVDARMQVIGTPFDLHQVAVIRHLARSGVAHETIAHALKIPFSDYMQYMKQANHAERKQKVGLIFGSLSFLVKDYIKTLHQRQQ